MFPEISLYHPHSWLIAMSILLVLLYKFVGFLRNYRHLRKIPGPAGYPIIGKVDLMFLKPVELFSAIGDYAKTFYPTFKISIGFSSVVIIVSPDDVETMISQIRRMEKGRPYLHLRDWLKEGLLLSDGDKWQHRRKLLTPTFHFAILNQFTKIFTDESNKLVKAIKELSNDPVDVLSVIAKFTLQSICETAMGTKLEEHEAGREYMEAINKKLALTADRWVIPWQHNDYLYKLTSNYWKSRLLLKYIRKFTMNVIKHREESSNVADVELKGNGSNTKTRIAMLDLLLSAKLKGNSIDDDGIQEEVDTFMLTGSDTTASSLTFSLMLLASHREVQQKVCDELKYILGDSKRDFTMEDLNEMKYLERVIKESLRMYPSVPFISRRLSEDMTTTSGQYIPKGTTVAIFIYSMHRDPMYYKEPEKFNPDRFILENMKGKHPYVYIPFSAGLRNCIGQKFAMLEMKAAIATILRNFELHPVDSPETVQLKFSLILESTKPILVEFRGRERNSF